MRKTEPKKNWSLTSSAFRRLLDWLDEGKNSDGQNYLEMRERLVAYFDRKNCLSPDEFADETLNRVARRIDEEGTIETETPAKYCYIVARFVFLESLREINKAGISLDDVSQPPLAMQAAAAAENAEKNTEKEKRLDCLEKCVGQLEAANRELITGYYFGTERVKIENRRALAQKLGISVNALSIRACRIRSRLETCVVKCAAEN
jgi:DNA-directed RNA polymerase specialized sigma24 family protein